MTQPFHRPPVDTSASTNNPTAQQISTPMIAALEQAWSDIRTRHADVPAAVIVLGAGSIGVPAGVLKLGHFAAMRWRTDQPAGGTDGELLAEVASAAEEKNAHTQESYQQ